MCRSVNWQMVNVPSGRNRSMAGILPWRARPCDGPGLRRPPSAAAFVLGAGARLAALCGRAGRAVVPAAAWRGEGAPGRWGLSFLFGSAALGPAFLGAALVGLFRPGLLTALLLLAAAAGSLRRGRRGPLVRPALRALGGMGPVRSA